MLQQSDKLDKKCFIVDGNIGAGKSTFLKLIKKYLNVQIVLEPHEQWQNVGGSHNLLEKFYQDMPRWAYTFQSYAFITRIQAQQQAEKTNPYMMQILERSVFSDRYCFAKSSYEQGKMSALEWNMYTQWFSWLVDNYVTKPAGFIYLQTDPQVCYQRLIKRNRHEESMVSIDYLKQLHDKHESWLIGKHDVAPFLKEVPVLVLNCNEDFALNTKQLEQHVEQIISFVSPSLAHGELSAQNSVRNL